jgi:hypothetical protein
VPLADRAAELLDGLPRDWEVARIDALVEEPSEADRAALILGPAAPGRNGSQFTLHVSRSPERAGASRERALRVLGRLDEAGIRTRLKLGDFDLRDPALDLPEAPSPREQRSLAAAWNNLVAGLPADWSDLYAEVRLDSTDFLERGALLLAPVNPARADRAVGFRFRVARRFGYGAAPEMARRTLERLDEERITGELTVLRVHSDTRPVATQGPVWRIGGRAV